MLKERIKTGKPILVGNVWDPLSARILQKAGFDALNVATYNVAGSLGVPDVGLIPWTEYLEVTRKVASYCHLPILVDGEQGFGYENLTAYTFGEFERVGAHAIRVDDKAGDVKCPYLGEPDVVPAEIVVGKIKAVLRHRKSEDFMIYARSSAAHRYGFDECLRRLKTFQDAGAEMLFISTWSTKDLERYRKAFSDIPLCMSITPFGQKEFAGMTMRQAVDMGYQLIFCSSTIFFAAVKRAMETARILVETGDPRQIWPEGYWGDEFLELVEFPKWINPVS